MGSLICLHKYKKIIANKKYGDFGIMQMVKNVLGYFLAFTGIFLAGYFIVVPLFRTISNLIAIKFKIIPYLKEMSLQFDWINFLSNDFRLAFIVMLLFAISFFFFYQAHKNAGEKMIKSGFLPMIPYFLFYYLLKGIILLITLLHLPRGRKIKW